MIGQTPLYPRNDSRFHVFVDNRVGGRLNESNIEEPPYIISGSHVIATATVRDVHNLANVGVG